MIPPRPHIGALGAYALADLSDVDAETVISLSQNECLRGPSPRAVEAAAQAAAEAHLYPDPDWTALRAAIGAVHGIDPDGIVCGNGSLDLIGAIARAYGGPGRAVLAPAHAYPFFRSATGMSGARFDTAPEVDLQVNVDTLLAAVRPDTAIVFVANPGNPTGTFLPRTELLRLRAGLPDSVLLIIDEAYGEFADHLDARLFDLVEQGNTVVLRTFSKAYGMAGMRVGWGLFPPAIAGEIRKLLNPNNVSAMTQAAACAAVQDQAYMNETCAMTAQIRDGFSDDMRRIGLHVPPCHTNFVLMQFGDAEQAQAAEVYLRGQGVILRSQAGAGLPECLRATVGVASDMDITARLLKNWMERMKT